jgi:transposase-like protein
MKVMAKHRSHSIEFKRQVAQEFIAGETLHALSSRYDVSRNLIRIWVRKFEAERSMTTCRRLICFSATRPRSRLDDARRKCEAWRRDYNAERPHSAIGNKAPIELIDQSVAHGPP